MQDKSIALNQGHWNWEARALPLFGSGQAWSIHFLPWVSLPPQQVEGPWLPAHSSFWFGQGRGGALGGRGHRQGGGRWGRN